MLRDIIIIMVVVVVETIDMAMGEQINFCNYNGNNSNKPSHNEKKQEKEKNIYNKGTKKIEIFFYRCEMNEHWSRTFLMTKHLVDVYHFSLKRMEMDLEIKFIHPHLDNYDIYLDPLNRTHLDVVDFFSKLMRKLIFLVMIIIS